MQAEAECRAAEQRDRACCNQAFSPRFRNADLRHGNPAVLRRHMATLPWQTASERLNCLRRQRNQSSLPLRMLVASEVQQRISFAAIWRRSAYAVPQLRILISSAQKSRISAREVRNVTSRRRCRIIMINPKAVDMLLYFLSHVSVQHSVAERFELKLQASAVTCA